MKTYGWLSPEKLKFINENPSALSLLYDLGLLPEEISARIRGIVEEETKEQLRLNERMKIALERILNWQERVQQPGGEMDINTIASEGLGLETTVTGSAETECPHCEGGQICTDTVDCDKCGATGKLPGPCQCKKCAEKRNHEVCSLCYHPAPNGPHPECEKKWADAMPKRLCDCGVEIPMDKAVCLKCHQQLR